MIHRLVVRRTIRGSDASRTYDIVTDDESDDSVVIIQWVFNLMLELRLAQRDDCTFLYGVGKDKHDPKLPRQEGPRQVFYVRKGGTDIYEIKDASLFV